MSRSIHVIYSSSDARVEELYNIIPPSGFKAKPTFLYNSVLYAPEELMGGKARFVIVGIESFPERDTGVNMLLQQDA